MKTVLLRALSKIASSVIALILFGILPAFATDTTAYALQKKRAIAQIQNDIDRLNYFFSYVPCANSSDFFCNDALNTGTALFSDPGSAIAQLKDFNEKQSNTLLWVFSGRLYFKYNELDKKALSEDEIANYVPTGGIGPIVRPEEVRQKVHSIKTLGLDKLGDDVLSIVKAKYPNRQILILFITESFIAAPDFKLDDKTRKLSAEVLTAAQKNIFFRQSSLEPESKKRVVDFFHRSYLDELDKLDNSNDKEKRNAWLNSTVKDILSAITNDAKALSQLPTSPRERAYAYALEKANYNRGLVYSLEEFKPGGYRYNYNAFYNAKGYFDGSNGSGIVGWDMNGVNCGPNYIYPNTTAIAGIVNINATGDRCTRVTDAKLVQHYLERGAENLSKQISDAVEFSLVAEAKLAEQKNTSQQSKLFLARKNLLNYLAFNALPEDQQNLYAYSEGDPFTATEIKFRNSPRTITIKPRSRPLLTPTQKPGPTVTPGAMLLQVAVIAAVILDESIKSGKESFKALETIKLLFELYNALDVASEVADFDELVAYEIADPDPANKEMLRQLKDLYEHQRESMGEEEVNLYFWLLCYLEGDCRGPDPLKFEWHHIIPTGTRPHELVQAALKCPDKFYFNGEENLISLQKYVKETGQGRHTTHPKYNEWVFRLMNKIISDYEQENQNMKPDPCKSKELLLKLIAQLREIIETEDTWTINKIGTEYLKK